MITYRLVVRYEQDMYEGGPIHTWNVTGYEQANEAIEELRKTKFVSWSIVEKQQDGKTVEYGVFLNPRSAAYAYLSDEYRKQEGREYISKWIQ